MKSVISTVKTLIFVALSVIYAGCSTTTEITHEISPANNLSKPDALKILQAYVKDVSQEQDKAMSRPSGLQGQATTIDTEGIHCQLRELTGDTVPVLVLGGTLTLNSKIVQVPKNVSFTQVYGIKDTSYFCYFGKSGLIWLYDKEGSCLLGIYYGYPEKYENSVSTKDVLQQMKSALATLCPNIR
jgi:hypothetical protein